MSTLISSKGGGEILLLGRFEVLKKLGEGRFGKVYLVRDRVKGDLYALKEAKDPIYIGQLLNEAQNVLLIDHPHLVKLYHYFTSRSGNRVYLLYEYCDGGDLKGYVGSKGGKLPPQGGFKYSPPNNGGVGIPPPLRVYTPRYKTGKCFG